MINGYLKLQVLWYYRNTTPIDITKYVRSIQTEKNFDPKNNSASIILYDNDLIYSSGSFLPTEGDKITIYAKIITNNDYTSFLNDDNIWTGIYLDHERNVDVDKKLITLKVTDLEYKLFNRMWSKSYYDAGMKTDEIIVDIVKQMMYNSEGDGTYSVNFAGVETKRIDGSDFPVINPVLINKPVYEWIKELSTPQWTNSDTEIENSTQVMTKQMIFKIKDTTCYWYYPDSSTYTTIDSDTFIIDIKQSTGNEQAVNFLIVEAGDDLNGEPIFWYVYDDKSALPVQKDKYEHKPIIAGENSDYDNQYHALRKEAIDNSWTNDEFKEKVAKLVESYADYWFREYGRPRTTLQITLPLQSFDVGEYIYMNLNNYDRGLYLIKKVGYKITEKEASVTITCEQEVE